IIQIHLAEWFWVCCAAQREQAPSPQVYRLLSKAAFACANEDEGICLLLRFLKVSRCKSETISSHYQKNG
ncbi:hypothetical protein, partial [Pseudomonas sp. SWRI154]|uniref:hypothetical protein n=1 Tax=Pseudomonas sp. SWRI154 TaxID=2745501 RepID=UPI001EE161D9